MIIIIFAHLNECYTLHLCGTVELKSPIVVFHSIENIPLVGHTNPKMGFEQNFHNLNLGPGLVVNFGLRSILLSLSITWSISLNVCGSNSATVHGKNILL